MSCNQSKHHKVWQEKALQHLRLTLLSMFWQSLELVQYVLKTCNDCLCLIYHTYQSQGYTWSLLRIYHQQVVRIWLQKPTCLWWAKCLLQMKMIPLNLAHQQISSMRLFLQQFTFSKYPSSIFTLLNYQYQVFLQSSSIFNPLLFTRD